MEKIWLRPDLIRKLEGVEVLETQVVVDSSTRDKALWPTPSEFAIELDDAIDNVVGHDVMEAMIPNSTYIVDNHNNRLSFGYRTGGSASNAADVYDTVSEYGISDSVARIMSDTDPNRTSIGFLETDYNLLGIVPHSGFFIASRYSTDLFPYHVSDVADLPSDPIDIYANEPLRNPLPTFQVLGVEYVVLKMGRFYVYSILDELRKVPYQDGKVVEYAGDNGYPSKLTGYTATEVSESVYTSTIFNHSVDLHNVALENGDYDDGALPNMIIDSMATYVLAAVPLAPEVPILVPHPTSVSKPNNYYIQRRINWYCREPFWLDMQRSSCDEVIGLAELSRDGFPDNYRKMRFRDNRRLFGGIPDAGGYAVKSPGLMQTIGTKYIKIRCPELERGMFVDPHQPWTVGIGLFKVYRQTFAHLRFDWNNFNVNTWLISSLKRMTFRCERSDGSLYDFKGRDWIITLSIKRWVPSFGIQQVPDEAVWDEDATCEDDVGHGRCFPALGEPLLDGGALVGEPVGCNDGVDHPFARDWTV